MDALTFVLQEKQFMEDATFNIREKIRKARRNYECKYDDPVDTVTGKKKLFIPLTKQEVNSVATRFDLDPDAISIATNEPGLHRKAMIWEELLKAQFKKMKFKERMKQNFIPLVNEGTFVMELYWDAEKKNINFTSHDLKNIYMFPKEDSLENSSAFGVLMTQVYGDIMNDKRLSAEAKRAIQPTDLVSDQTTSSQQARMMQYEIGKSEYFTELDNVDVYRRYGLFPKRFLSLARGEQTADTEKDLNSDLVEGCIAISNPDKTPTLLYVEETKDRANFMESWFYKRHYVWFGGGIGVDLIDYQFYYNKMFNRRDNNEDVLHNGMFIKKRGMNVDARQRTTGAGVWIDVEDPTAVKQLNTTDITQGTYRAEENLLGNVQRLNGTYQIALGGGTSYSASEAAIKDKNSQTRLADAQAYLDRMFKLAVERAMGLISDNCPKDIVVKLTGDDARLAVFDDFKLKTVNSARADEGLPPVSPDDYKAAMLEFGTDRFLKIPNTKFLSGDFEVTIDNDSSLVKNKSGMSQFLMETLKAAGQIPSIATRVDFADLFQQILDLNGVKVKMITQAPQNPMMPQPVAAPGAAPPDMAKMMAGLGGAPGQDGVMTPASPVPA